MNFYYHYPTHSPDQFDFKGTASTDCPLGRKLVNLCRDPYWFTRDDERYTMKTVSLPAYTPRLSHATKVDYPDFLAAAIEQLSYMPDFLLALKKADTEGWQKLVKDLGQHVQTDPLLSNFMLPRNSQGEQGVALGDADWEISGAVTAFAAGYALGTLNY